MGRSAIITIVYVKISKLADRGDFAGARRYPWVYNMSSTTTGSPSGSQGTPTGNE
jgi:hypothetical protein